MSQDLQLTRRHIFEELTKIVDPEIGVSIMELELIDKVDIDNGKVNVDLHLTSPFCPGSIWIQNSPRRKRQHTQGRRDTRSKGKCK